MGDRPKSKEARQDSIEDAIAQITGKHPSDKTSPERATKGEAPKGDRT